MINEAKQNIDLVSVAESVGVKMRQSGPNHVGLCPFHSEITPSFFVFPANRFKCFGCGASGDCIDFVQKLHGLSFRDTLKYLGIEQGRITPKVKQDIERRKHRAELVRKFRDWEQYYGTYISDLWHKTKRLMVQGIPPKDLDLYAPLFHMLPIWEHHREILIHGTDKQKFSLFQEAQRCRKKILT